jgi:hypothetical protein
VAFFAVKQGDSDYLRKGHLEKGGTFSVRRCEVSPKEWVLTTMEVDINGKALFLKTISVHQKEYRSDFRKVPNNLTFGVHTPRNGGKRAQRRQK